MNRKNCYILNYDILKYWRYICMSTSLIFLRRVWYSPFNDWVRKSIQMDDLPYFILYSLYRTISFPSFLLVGIVTTDHIILCPALSISIKAIDRLSAMCGTSMIADTSHTVLLLMETSLSQYPRYIGDVASRNWKHWELISIFSGVTAPFRRRRHVFFRWKHFSPKPFCFLQSCDFVQPMTSAKMHRMERSLQKLITWLPVLSNGNMCLQYLWCLWCLRCLGCVRCAHRQAFCYDCCSLETRFEPFSHSIECQAKRTLNMKK